jgi:hypothetical protein
MNNLPSAALKGWTDRDKELYNGLPVLLANQLLEERSRKLRAVIKGAIKQMHKPRKWKPNLGNVFR